MCEKKKFRGITTAPLASTLTGARTALSTQVFWRQDEVLMNTEKDKSPHIAE